jgi:hypothetical protein
MDRRDFLKTLGIVGAGAVILTSAVLTERTRTLYKPHKPSFVAYYTDGISAEVKYKHGVVSTYANTTVKELCERYTEKDYEIFLYSEMENEGISYVRACIFGKKETPGMKIIPHEYYDIIQYKL